MSSVFFFTPSFPLNHPITLVFGEKRVHELCEGGSEMMLTMDNRDLYVTLYTDYILNISIKDSFDAFKYVMCPSLFASHSSHPTHFFAPPLTTFPSSFFRLLDQPFHSFYDCLITLILPLFL